MDTFDGDTFGTVISEKPVEGAPPAEWKEYLDSQLDSVIGRIVLRSLTVLGGQGTRLHGGMLRLGMQIVRST